MTDKALDKRGEDIETIVGPSVKVEGDLNSDGNIVIEGQVNGKIKTTKQLRVFQRRPAKLHHDHFVLLCVCFVKETPLSLPHSIQ